MCSLSCLSQWPNVLRRWRRVCWFFLTLNPFSRQRDGELGHRASLFSGAPCLPRPELFIRLGEVTHTSIIHSASPVSSYPCRRRCCENPKGGPLWARRSSRLTVTQHFATAAHCDGICISWIGNYQVVKRASLKEEMSLNPNWDFQPFCKWFSVCGSFFFLEQPLWRWRHCNTRTPQNMSFAVARLVADTPLKVILSFLHLTCRSNLYLPF